MPENTKKLDFQTQRMHWQTAYNNSKWQNLAGYFKTSLYEEFLTSTDTLLFDIIWNAYKDKQNELVTQLLKKCKPDIRNKENQTLLVKACQAEAGLLIDMILDHSVDPMLLQKVDSRALDFSYTQSRLEFLLSETSDVRLIYPFIAYFKLHYFADQCIWSHSIWETVAHSLVEAVDDAIDSVDDEAEAITMLQVLLSNNVNSNARDHKSKTLLYKACEYSYPDLITLLLQYNADPLLPGTHQENALSPIAYVSTKQSWPLIKPFVDIEENVDAQDEDGNTILHSLINNNENRTYLCNMTLQFVPYILQKHANPNIANKQGNTALHNAMQLQESDIAKTLIEHLFSSGADFSCKNASGKTPLQLASTQAIGHYGQTLLDRLEDIQKEYEFSEKQYALTYLRLNKGFNFYRGFTPKSEKQKFFCIAYATSRRFQWEKCSAVPTEIAQLILQHYLWSFDSEQDYSSGYNPESHALYKLSNITALQLSLLMTSKFFQMYVSSVFKRKEYAKERLLFNKL